MSTILQRLGNVALMLLGGIMMVIVGAVFVVLCPGAVFLDPEMLRQSKPEEGKS